VPKTNLGKKSSKGNILFFKGNILLRIFFIQKNIHKKNQKLIFFKNIAAIITTTSAYNFEETCENVFLEHF
jgi:hypothetical protein